MWPIDRGCLCLAALLLGADGCVYNFERPWADAAADATARVDQQVPPLLDGPAAEVDLPAVDSDGPPPPDTLRVDSDGTLPPDTLSVDSDESDGPVVVTDGPVVVADGPAPDAGLPIGWTCKEYNEGNACDADLTTAGDKNLFCVEGECYCERSGQVPTSCGAYDTSHGCKTCETAYFTGCCA